MRVSTKIPRSRFGAVLLTLWVSACAPDSPVPEAAPASHDSADSLSLGRNRHDGPDAGMVSIPAGAFPRGEPNQPAEAQPTGLIEPRRVHLDRFWIDRYEYPNLEGALPSTEVHWYDAKRLCEERGKRLCTADEWEKACRGPKGFLHSYSNEFSDDACHTPQNFDNHDPAPSGSHPRCRSEYGVYDMIGNVNEWTADVVTLAQVRRSPNRNNYGNDDFWRDERYPEWPILLGGDWGTSPEQLRCTYRGHFHPPDHELRDDGFRCCADERPESDRVAPKSES